MPRIFRNRVEAGQAVAAALHAYAERHDLLVLALPRGGVPVALEVVHALHAPLDLMVVRKLGVPGHEELAMGAIAAGGGRVINGSVVRQAGLSEDDIERATERERAELQRRERVYRGDRPAPDLHNRCVILIDDGLATGATMLAAVRAVQQGGASSVVAAVPVAPADICAQLREEADDVVCVETPAMFMGIGQWYDNFAQTTDEEVQDLLRRAWSQLPSATEPSGARAQG